MNTNKIKEYWNKSSIWKQGLIIGVLIFISLFVFAINKILTSSSELRFFFILIPLTPLSFFFQSYRNFELQIPFALSLAVNILLYYIFGLLIAMTINKVINKK